MKGKICRLITGLVIATTLLTSCSAIGNIAGEVEDIVGGYTQKVNQNTAAKLSSSDVARFEAYKGVPIDIIVDEGSVNCMTEAVKNAIKRVIEQYNEMFSYINPDYQLRYVSKNEYERNKTNNPLVFITTHLSIKTSAGYARAVTSPPEPTISRYGNGEVYSSATVIISSTGTVKLTEDELQNVIAHEFGHVFGILEHSEDRMSMMSDTSKGVTISSKEFSLDMLTAFKKMYYNPQTNSKSESEIDEYIAKVSSLRQQQVEEYVSDSQGSSSYEGKDSLTNFNSSLASFLENKGCKRVAATQLVGGEYTATSMYGQTRTIIFNEDGTYVLQVSDSDRLIECKGRYKIQGNVAVCEGEYFSVDENFNYVKTQDKLYFAATEDGCVYGTESRNGVATDDLIDSSLVDNFEV